MSPDGRCTVVVIALLGNPFSPAYARARARGSARALDFAAFHVAIDTPAGKFWSLREHAIADGARSATRLPIGRSSIERTARGFTVRIDETTTPGGRPLRGEIELSFEGNPGRPFALDPAGEHFWWPVAPLAHAQVRLREPEVTFDGSGYTDANAGRRALESSFASWSWSRARVDPRRTAVAYDLAAANGDAEQRTLVFGRDGVELVTSLPRVELPATRWGLARQAKADPAAGVTLLRTLEDGPCYARALIGTRVLGKPVIAVHETLSGARLRRAWVRFLLGFRIGQGPASARARTPGERPRP